MTVQERNLICELAGRLLPAYDNDGNTVDEYYNNIILPELTRAQMETLKKIAAYDI